LPRVPGDGEDAGGVPLGDECGTEHALGVAEGAGATVGDGRGGIEAGVLQRGEQGELCQRDAGDREGGVRGGGGGEALEGERASVALSRSRAASARAGSSAISPSAGIHGVA
jgi:hypothetical protein